MCPCRRCALPALTGANMSTLEGILAVLGAISTAVAAWLGYQVRRRVNTGTIQTSDAQDLWEEGRQMRQALRDEVAALKARNIALELENAELKVERAQRNGVTS